MNSAIRACAALILASFCLSTPAFSAEPPRKISSEKRSIPREGITAEKLRRLSVSEGRIDVLIELNEPPVATMWAANHLKPQPDRVAAAQAHLSRINQAQSQVITEIGKRSESARIHSRTQRVFNGIAANVDARSIAAIRAIPGVRAIYPSRKIRLHHTSSVPFIRAPQAWVHGAGLRGNGIRIGIIDTGIDYIHVNFGGSGSAADYANNDDTIITDGLFPTAKVVGGFDFIGDDAANPLPDPDPMDCSGHGTHVAGTAAGLGVFSDGQTYDGPIDLSTDFSELRIGPGVAPGASLFALKVFDCDGRSSSAGVLQALEWATDPNDDANLSDHLDVVNMSLGSDFGSDIDPLAVASNNAVSAGVIVVASAGNDGDTYYASGSPATATNVISVAASRDDGFPAIEIEYEVGVAFEMIPAQPSTIGPGLTDPGITGEVVWASASTACASISNAVGSKIVGVDRGGCAFDLKVKNAQDAGALAVIVADNVPGPLVVMGPSDPPEDVTIPSVFISQEDGNQLRTAAGAGTVTARLALSLFTTIPARGDTVPAFSSRGLRRLDNQIKPDITAPGTGIVSAAAGTGSDGLAFSGTSMASPHVAGTMALLRQLHPDWTVEELKALIMNTAQHDLFLSENQIPPRYGPGRVGAGRVDVEKAVSSQVIAFDAEDPGLVSVSFGRVEVEGTHSSSREIRIKNTGPPADFELSVDPIVNNPGVALTLSDGTALHLDTNEEESVTLTLSAIGSSTLHLPDPTIELEQEGLPRHWLAEENGYVTLTDVITLDVVARELVSVAVAPASAMTAKGATQQFVAIGTFSDGTSHVISGTPLIDPSPSPFDEASLLTFTELQGLDPLDPDIPAPAAASDLHVVGIGCDVPGSGDFADTEIYFAIGTHANWSTPLDVEFDVFIDTDRDGTPDFTLFNTFLPGDTPLDIPISALFDLNTSSIVDIGFVNVFTAGVSTRPYNSNVMVLATTAGALGLTPGSSRFNYSVRSASDFFIGEMDSIEGLTYDPGAPGLNFTDQGDGPPMWEDRPGSIPVFYNYSNYRANQSLGALAFHHHNRSGNRVEIVNVSVPPVAEAGANRTVECTGPTTTVELDAGATTDPDHALSELIFEWKDSASSQVLGTGQTLSVELPRGSHLITLTATDPDGGFSTDTILVIVSDTTAPTVACPADLVLDTASVSRIVDYLALLTANDACSSGAEKISAQANGLTITGNPPSGSLFPLGTTTVNVTATDQVGLTATCSFEVTIVQISSNPTLTAVSPDQGSTRGGTPLTLSGTNFQIGATVTIGGNPATNVVVADADTITATAPAHTRGLVNVTVTNIGGGTATLSEAYRYGLFDPDGDHALTVADIFQLINALFVGGPALPVAAGDANGDGVVNVADVLALVSFLFGEGEEPV